LPGFSQLHAEFNDELQALKDEFLSERNTLIDLFEKEINDIKDILFAMEVRSGRIIRFDNRINQSRVSLFKL
jgi:hypothetical protein